MKSTKKYYIPEKLPKPNPGFWGESLAKEKKVLLDQLRDNADSIEADPYLRMMHTKSSSSPEHLKIPDSMLATPLPASPISLVDDKGGEFLLSRGTLPHSIPTRNGLKKESPDLKKLQMKYDELQNELNSINNAIDKKQTEIRYKLRHADSSIRATTASRRLSNKQYLYNPATVGSAITGYGFQWNGTLNRNSPSGFGSGPVVIDEMDRKAFSSEVRSAGVWGDMTKGLDLPQRSLYLRTEPFVPKLRVKMKEKDA